MHQDASGPLRCPLGTLTADWPMATQGLRDMQCRDALAADADCDQLAWATLAAYEGGLLLAQATGELEPLRAALAAARSALATYATG